MFNYPISRFRVVRFSNFLNPSPNYAAPTSPNLLELIKLMN